MLRSDHPNHCNDRAHAEPSPIKLGRHDFGVVVRVIITAVTIYGLWQMGRAMRIVVMIGGLAALLILVAVVALIVHTVRKDQREKGTGNGQTVPPPRAGSGS